MNCLFDAGGQIARLILGQPRNELVFSLKEEPGNPDRNRCHKKDKSQPEIEGKENYETHDDRDQVCREQHKTKTQPAANQVQIRNRPGKQLPRGPAIMESNWKILQLLVELVAHVSLDICTRGQHQPAPKQHEQCLENTKKQN